MSSQFFKADSNFGIKLQKILSKFKDGLSPDHIIRELRKTGTHVYDVNSIMNILDDRKYFIKLSGDIYCLKSSMMSRKDIEDFNVPEKQIEQGDSPTIINLPYCLENYIIFDLETTGFDPEKNSIIQISALKVINNESSDFLNLYVDPCGEISPEIKNILNLSDRPWIVEKIYSSPSIETQYKIFKLFCEDLPLIAHNLKFDFSFLNAVDPSLNNILLDTMELALLTLPGIETYKLESLVNYLNIKASEIEKLADRFFIDDFSCSSFHDARVDVLYLYRLYVLLLDKFLSGPSGQICSRIFKQFIQ